MSDPLGEVLTAIDQQDGSQVCSPSCILAWEPAPQFSYSACATGWLAVSVVDDATFARVVALIEDPPPARDALRELLRE